MAERVGFEPTCRLPDKTLSRRPRYDHFGTSPGRVLAVRLTADPTYDEVVLSASDVTRTNHYNRGLTGRRTLHPWRGRRRHRPEHLHRRRDHPGDVRQRRRDDEGVGRLRQLAELLDVLLGHP